MLPAAVILLMFGDLVTGLLFERGEFDSASTSLVAAILAAYAVGLVASSSVKLFASGFHAMQDTRTPLRYTGIAVATGVSLGAAAMFWMKSAGYGASAATGLVLGGALGAWLNLALLWRGLRARLGPILDPRARRGVIRIIVATAAAGLAATLAQLVVGGWVEADSAVSRALVLGVVLVAGAIPYLAIAGRPDR